jgi:ATP-dependent Clp protease adaptor protein ClpS
MQTVDFPEVEILDKIEEGIVDTDIYDLIVFNDDVNTFDYVIEVLVDICEHEPEQAEQCTMIIHYKGKCAVKKGSFDEMASMRNALCQRGLSAEVM